MISKKRASQAAAVLLISSLLTGIPAVSSQAAVITSNATDKIAVLFHADTAYSAGDYVIYDGELYICTGDSTGKWETAQTNFMQITKNRELGTCEELSASYHDAEDPSAETSLMSFVANAWQKLKVFLGVDDKEATANGSNYKNASVSAKLNYLEEQNSTMDSDLSTLKGNASDLKGSVSDLKGSVSDLNGKIEKSFQSVSSGKQKLTDAITDEGGTASSSYSFEQFSQAIIALSRAQRQSGEAAGQAKGYEEGRTSGLEEGRVQGLEEGRAQGAAEGKAQGVEEGRAQGRTEGINEADGRVNTDSASYKQGYNDGGIKVFSTKIEVDYDGAKSDRKCFSITDTESLNVIAYKYKKQFEGHTIIGVLASNESWVGSSGTGSRRIMLLVDGVIQKVREERGEKDYGDVLTVKGDTIEWGKFAYNRAYKDNSGSKLELTVLYI